MSEHSRTSAPPLAGSVTLSGDAIAQVVGHTVVECYGIVGMASKSLAKGMARMLTRDSLTQGIEIERSGDELRIDLYVIMEYGLNLAEVAAAVRSRVIYQVEQLTRLDVREVQVHIQGVKRR
jgi:uncharacterized alkaline shock family protein YloU